MSFVCVFASRITLIAINSLCVMFACLVIYYGSVGLFREGNRSTGISCSTNSTNTSCHIPILEHPFTGLIALGSFILIFSLCGIAGACCAVRFKEEATASRYRRYSSRALMVYYTGVMLINAGLFYVAMLCFLFAEKANDYIDAYWTAIQPDLCGSKPTKDCSPDALYATFKSNTNAGGVVCLFSIVINFLCAHCSAILMGYKYTMRKAMLLSNFCGFVLGLVTVVIAFLPETSHVGLDQGWLPGFIGALGIMVLLLCILGFVAAFRLSPPLFLMHAVLMSVVVVVLFSLGVFCLADANDAAAIVQNALPSIKNSIIDVCPNCHLNATQAVVSENDLHAFKTCCYKQAGMAVWNNLTVLGVSSIVTVLAMLVNTGGSVYLRRRVMRERAEAVERGEVDGVTGQPVGPEMKSRQAARADAYHGGDDPDDNL